MVYAPFTAVCLLLSNQVWPDEPSPATQELANAVYKLNVPAVRALIKRGAKLHPYMFHLAVNGRDKIDTRLAIMRELHKAGFDPKDPVPLLSAVQVSDPRTVKYLLEKGAPADPDERVVGLYRPLFYAITVGEPEKVRLLLDYGASATEPCARRQWPKEQTSVTVTWPLQAAAYHGKLQAAKLLVAKGAKVNFQNRAGETALHSAALKPKNEGMIRYLLSIGARTDIKTHAGETPSMIAKRKGYKENVAALSPRKQ
ncbi:MAG TPA: ankyrin repeat domain-containing protein [Fimbriimonadaceae bacterium]|nr:ankyrin repeat domain-containing protein [Fimbriimonadaceae bacterium]